MPKTPLATCYKLNSARNKLYDARRYLESGQAANWVGDSIRAAIMWAVDAWMLKNGHKGESTAWIDLQFQFLQIAPQPLRSIVSRCLAEIALVDYESTAQEWMEAMWRCLEDGEKVVTMIEEGEPPIN